MKLDNCSQPANNFEDSDLWANWYFKNSLEKQNTMTIGAISDAYDKFLESGDSRVTSWPFIDSPLPMITLIAAYLLFVKSIGPAWMQNKEPFELRKLMVLFNVALVIMHISNLIPALPILWRKLQNGICMEEEINDPDSLKLLESVWWFIFTRIVELGDTVFFVLRKKSNHISKMHVFHHSIVPLVSCLLLKIQPDSHFFFITLANTVVHVVTYFYYGLAALGPDVRQHLWWKKYLTLLQILQFVLGVIYLSILSASNCKFSKWVNFTVLSGHFIFLTLYLNYFNSAYGKQPIRKNVD